MKLFLGGILVLALLIGTYFKGPYLLSTIDQTINGPKTISERVQQYGNNVAARLRPDFIKAGVDYPPVRVTLVILKKERVLELYARGPNPDENAYHFIRSYPILAASGHLGPKLAKAIAGRANGRMMARMLHDLTSSFPTVP
jgi:hypothetical protein